MNKRHIISMIILIFMETVCFSQEQESALVNGVSLKMKNQKIPHFVGKSLSGIEWNEDSLMGKVTLFSFWFMGCVPCMYEINTLNKIAREYKGQKDFILISIAPQVKEDLIMFSDTSYNMFSAIRKMFKAEPIEYVVIPACNVHKERKNTQYLYCGPECDSIVKNFNIHGYPQVFISDKQGYIRFIYGGFFQDRTKSDIIYNLYKTKIDSLLKN